MLLELHWVRLLELLLLLLLLQDLLLLPPLVDAGRRSSSAEARRFPFSAAAFSHCAES